MQLQISARIAGQTFELDTHSVVRALEGVLPEPIRDHFVVVGGSRFPPKQVISILTGLDRADFTTHQARSVLRRMGFTVARSVGAPPAAPPEDHALPHGGRQAEALRPHRGRWVAVRGPEVLVAADSFDDVVSWLEHYDRHAEMVFRVPAGPDETDFPLTR